MKPEAKFQLQYSKEELHLKPNQVAVIKAIVEIRDESITEHLQHLIISMADCDLNDPRMCAENFCKKWKKVWSGQVGLVAGTTRNE